MYSVSINDQKEGNVSKTKNRKTQISRVSLIRLLLDENTKHGGKLAKKPEDYAWSSTG